MNISVVIATYNGSRFLEEQMESIRLQTLAPNEVYLSDDCSTDSTVSIVNAYINRNDLNNKWRIQKNKVNKGYAKNFLDAATQAKGDIIFFCDQDDVWIKDRIEVMSSVLDEHKDINLLCSSLQPFYQDKDTRRWSKKDLKEMTDDGTLEFPQFNSMNFHLKRAGCTMCIRKSFLKEIMPYWIDGWAHDDFVWKMATISNSCGILHYCSMKRRMHSNNATVIRVRTREGRVDQLQKFTQQFDSLKKYAKKIGASNEKIRIIEKNQQSILVRIDVVKNRYIWKWLILWFNYRDCYPRQKGLYLDLYITIFGKYKGV